MSSRNVEVRRSKHETFNRGDLDAATALFADSATYTEHPRGLVLKGPAEIKQWLAGWKAAFSDARCTDVGFMATENATISQFMGLGTNDGPLGDLAATDRSFAIPHCDIFEYDAEGRVVRAEHYYDQLSVLQQLGHMGQPETASVSQG
jgi:steroid delta-isomerase-like uncharacterized protein